MRGKIVVEVCELLVDMNGMLIFVFNFVNWFWVLFDREVYVCVYFDYYFYEDDLILCRELGLVFRWGDIFYVVK